MHKGRLVFIENIFKQQKISLIPLLFHNNQFVTHFKINAEMFDLFFAKQWV